MSGPEFLPEAYLHIRWSRARDIAMKTEACVREAFGRAIAQPAKSATTTVALGLLLGSGARLIFVRHSGPGRAGAAVASNAAQTTSSLAGKSTRQR